MQTEPRHFGTPESPLFGCYHAPQATPRQCAVLLCNPFGQEQVRAHRAFGLLANRLARLGFGALRFDYHGCGDSSGESDEGDVTRWTHDVATAIDELKAWTGASVVSLLGLRLGASLALLAADGRDDVESLVLWEPIVRGSDYIEQLLDAHRAWAREHRTTDNDTEGLEALGFPISPALRRDLQGMDLLSAGTPSARRVLVIEEEGEAEAAGFLGQLEDGNGLVEYRRSPGARIGMSQNDLGKVWVPTHAIQTIASWLADA